MKRQLTIKALTASDLTLFEFHFRKSESGNQKAINLNADVFVSSLYPELPNLAPQKGGKFGVDLLIYGPASAAELNLQRKVVKFGTYKNWRLDGEIINNPVGDEERFAQLQTGDLALIEFTGDHYPVSARMVLIASQSTGDENIHAILAPLVARKSMVALDAREFAAILRPLTIAEDHPVNNLLMEGALEDAALGGLQGAERLYRNRGRNVSRLELAQARQRADEMGYRGEELIGSWLETQLPSGFIDSYIWASDQNAVAPYDFELTRGANLERIDVKATSGDFERRIHVSLAELKTMAESAIPYRIYRVYDVADYTGKLRISAPMAAHAQQILDSLQMLPTGVTVDALSIDPGTLQFASPILLDSAPS